MFGDNNHQQGNHPPGGGRERKVALHEGRAKTESDSRIDFSPDTQVGNTSNSSSPKRGSAFVPNEDTSVFDFRLAKRDSPSSPFPLEPSSAASSVPASPLTAPPLFPEKALPPCPSCLSTKTSQKFPSDPSLRPYYNSYHQALLAASAMTDAPQQDEEADNDRNSTQQQLPNSKPHNSAAPLPENANEPCAPFPPRVAESTTKISVDPSANAPERIESSDAVLLSLLMKGPSGSPRIGSYAATSQVPHLATSTTSRLRKRVGPRLTIFSDDFVRQLEQRHGASDMTKMLRSATGHVVQAVVFILMVLLLGATPIIKEAALWDPEAGKKVKTFIPHTPIIVHFTMSVMISNFASWLTYGKVGLKDCWDFRSIAYISRVSILYSIGETMELFTLLHIDGTTWKILNQLKLPITAIANLCILKRTLTSTQWCLVASITVSVAGYCAAMKDSAALVSHFGLSIGFCNVIIIAMGGIMADHAYKQVKYPFFILIAHGRLSAAFFAILLMIAYQIYTRDFRWFFHGWTFRVAFLTLWLLAKDWAVTFVLRNLDSLWKAIGTALGLCVTYTLANIIIQYNLKWLVFVFVLSVVINIVAYTFTKHEQLEIDKQIRALQTNIAHQQKLLSSQHH